MSIKPASAFKKNNPRLSPVLGSLRLRPIALAIAGIGIAASGMSHAADATVAATLAPSQESSRIVSELQAEIAQLKQIIARQNAAAAGAADVVAGAPPTAGAVENPAAAGNGVAVADRQEEPQSLGAVTVQGRRRAALEKLKEVPASVSVVTGTELARLGAADISAITRRAANVVWNQGNQRTASVSIRGLGKIGTTEAQDPSVGVTVDGVSYAYNALTSSYDFTDVDTVQVGRGPQGALGGKNSSFGVINVTTNRPSFTPGADYSITYGQRHTVIGTLAAGGPIVDDLLAWRGTFSANKGYGDMTNAYNTDQTVTNIDRLSGRVQFLLTPTPDFNARVAVDVQPNASEATNGRTIYTPTPTAYSNGSVNALGTDASTRLARSWFTRAGSYTYQDNYLYGGGRNAVNFNGVGSQVSGSRGASAELNWHLGTHTLTSISAYKDYHFNAVNDEGTPFDINPNSGGFFNNYKQASQELRLSADTGGALDYSGGLYFMKNSNDAAYQKSWGSDAGAWFASTAQYNRLNATAAGQSLMMNSLDRLSMAYNSPAGMQNISNGSAAIYGQASWHASDALTFTGGARLTHEKRENPGSSSILDNGFGAALNPVSVGAVQLGGFASDSTGLLVAGKNSTAQLNLADAVARQYFGTAATAVPGAAYSSLTTAQRQQVADAKNIRAAQAGVIFNTANAETYSATLPTFNLGPSYRINDNLTTYVSLQYGEKAGISQFTNGVSSPVKSEKTLAYEIGFKSVLLDKTLLLNADLFLMNIRNYQQAVRVLDVYTTGLNNDGTNYYTTATGNVPKVQAKGLEFDGVYSGIKNTTLRFSGAYNDAVYKSFPNSAQPVENGYASASAYQDVTGQTLPGAAKLTFNIGVDYRLPVWRDQIFHTSFNTAFTGRYNSDVSLSQYAWIPANSITDFAIGLGNRKQTFDVSLLVKNLFANDTPLLQTWNSYTPANPRWVGVMFTGKL